MSNELPEWAQNNARAKTVYEQLKHEHPELDETKLWQMTWVRVGAKEGEK